MELNQAKSWGASLLLEYERDARTNLMGVTRRACNNFGLDQTRAIFEKASAPAKKSKVWKFAFEDQIDVFKIEQYLSDCWSGKFNTKTSS